MMQPVGERLRAVRAQYPLAFFSVVALLTLLIVANAVVAVRLWSFRGDVARLRASMTASERNRADLSLRSEDNRAKVVAELVRRQARADRDLHLAIEVDSGRMFLERDGVALREIPVAVGRDRPAGSAPDTMPVVVTRGEQTVASLLGANDAWEVPAWVFTDRATSVPPDRHTKGALGRNAIILNSGTVIYALPKDGPLADSTYILPGSLLLRAEDLSAIAPNVVRGMTVYLYE
ncbi:MAG: hypothetical protein ABI877_00770 [Gemmatimonadaceae bacterium]